MCRQQLLNYRGSFLLNNKLSCNRLLAQARRGCVSTRTHKARRKGIKDGKKQSKQSQDNNKSSILAFKAVKHRPSVIFFKNFCRGADCSSGCYLEKLHENDQSVDRWFAQGKASGSNKQGATEQHGCYEA